MISYTEWNRAIARYFTENVPYGSKIYLNIDDDTLELIGNSLSGYLPNQSWSQNFCTVVKNQVITDKDIDLDTILRFDNLGYPKSIAFLGLMVLAATRMEEDEKTDQKNYFIRFRQILTLPDDGKPRPKGLQLGTSEDAPEIQLWKTWNQWLLEQGFLPTAQEGVGVSNKYLNYPISQSLLRNVDKDRLRRVFSDKQWQINWDEQILFTKVANEYQRLSKHLKRLIDDRLRYEAVAGAIHATYEQWLNDGSSISKAGITRSREWSRQLYTGIYRSEDFLGNVEYQLYPRQPRGRSLDSLSVQCNENQYFLREDRAGWYLPVAKISKEEISKGETYSINPDTQVERLILPSRDFWILIPDPDNPESGIYASWGSPKLGEQFIILFRDSLFADLQRLRDENLIQWEGDHNTRYQVFGNDSDWYEIFQCQIISQAWDGVFIQSVELKDALQPTTKLSISFSEGLKVPKMHGWIGSHPPNITVFAFHPSVELSVIDNINNKKIHEQSYSSNQPLLIPFPLSGSFLLNASCLGESTQRLIKLLNWDEIDIQCHIFEGIDYDKNNLYK